MSCQRTLAIRLGLDEESCGPYLVSAAHSCHCHRLGMDRGHDLRCYGYGLLASRLWPLMPEEATGPEFARGMAIFVSAAIGFLTGWSLGLMTWSATWRRAKAIAALTSAHR